MKYNFKKILFSLCFIAGGFFVAGVEEASAAEWWVRSSAGEYGVENGTDYDTAFDGPGAIEWESVQPGDTIWFAGDISLGAGALIINASGIEGNQIYIRGDNISHPCTAIYTTSTSNLFYLNDKNFVTISGFSNVYSPGTKYRAFTSGVGNVLQNMEFSGDTVDDSVVVLENQVNSTIRDVSITGTFGYGVHCFNCDSPTIAEVSATGGIYSAIYTNNSNDVIVDGITASNMSQHSILFIGVTGASKIENISSIGAGSSATQVSSSCDGVTLNNISSTSDKYGVKIIDSTNITGYNINTLLADINGLFIQGSSEVVIEDSNFEKSLNDGAYIDTSQNWTLRRSWFKGSGSINSLTNSDGLTTHNGIPNITGAVIEDSFFIGNKSTGLALAAGGGVVRNCVFYGNGGNFVSQGGVDMNRAGVWISSDATSPNNWELINNVVEGNYPREIYLSSTAQSNGVFDYNLYNHAGASIIEDNFATVDGGEINISWASYALYEPNSIYGAPFFIDAFNNNFDLTPISSAIDSGNPVGLTTDYAGNPIYGTPDIGAYEYQPPHTMGSDKIDIGAGARIYGDGKFRDKETTNSNLADLLITPESGNFEIYESDEARPEWMDIKNIIWEASIKKWTESSSDSSLTNTLHTVGDLTPGAAYTLKIDNTLAADNIESTDCKNGICTANQDGKLAFIYTGTYSEHTFELTANQELPEDENIDNNNQETEFTKISNIKSDNLTLDENKKIYLEEDRTKLKGEDQSIANGKVKIYKNNKLYKEIDVDEKGKWSKKISFDHDRNYDIKLEFFDEFDTLHDTKEYEIKVDTENPTFKDEKYAKKEKEDQLIPTTKNDKIVFTAEDEDTDIEYYKIKVLDKNGHILRSWRKQSESFYLIPNKIKDEAKTIIVRAYDRAGNKSELTFNIDPRKALPRGEGPAQLLETDGDGEAQEVIEVETETFDKQEESQESSPEPITGNNSSETKTEIQPIVSEKQESNPQTDESRWWNPFSWF